jgi:hypothetical protein
MIPPAPQFQVLPPRLLTFSTVLVISGYGLLLIIPVLLAILLVSLQHLSVLTFLLPICAAGLTTFFLPLGFGNPYVVKLARSLRPTTPTTPESFVAQITFSPRLRSGLRALLEDADDIGWVSFTESGLNFDGDSVQLHLPFEYIRELRTESIGWRGLFIYGPQTVVGISGLPNASALKLAERSSWLLPDSRKNAQRLQNSLAAKVKLAGRGGQWEGRQVDTERGA